jgi:hypothetical protein
LAYSVGVAVETYVLEARKSKPSLKERALSILLFASMYFLIMLALNFFWFSPHVDQESVSRIALRVVFISVFWGVTMPFMPKTIPRCNLLVEDNSITSVIEYTGWMKWYKTRRTVSARNVHTMIEVVGKDGAPVGLSASDRTGWGARMWGGIYIPRALPEYEQLKALVESWKAPESAD